MHKTSYEQAREGASFFRHATIGYVAIQGEDRLDFLQRQTTNDMQLLEQGRVMLNVLTNASARILGVFQMMVEGQTVWLVTLGGCGPLVFDFLRSRIFFMDRVEVIMQDKPWATVDLEGPLARELAGIRGLALPKDAGALVEVEWEGIRAKVASQAGLTAEIGYRWMLPADQASKLCDKLSEQGASELDDATYEALRIEAGSPLGPNELNEKYTPLEVGLEAAISATKGCYTGQEVIARQITYEKVTKRMAVLKLETGVKRGSQILVGGKSVGRISSTAESPRLGAIALGVLRVPHHQPGTGVAVRDGAEQISGEVLPAGA